MNFISVSTQPKNSSREKKMPMQKSISIHRLNRCKNNASLNSELCFAMAQPYLWHSFFDIVYGISVCVCYVEVWLYPFATWLQAVNTDTWEFVSMLLFTEPIESSTSFDTSSIRIVWCSMLAKQSHCYFARLCLLTAHRWHSFIHLEYHWLFQLIRFNQYKVEFMHCVCFE